MWSAPVFIFCSPEQIYIFSQPVGPQRVDWMPQWTKIHIKVGSEIPVDWDTYAPTVNTLWTLDEQKLSTRYRFGPF